MNLKISYQTLLLPAPYAFGYTLDIAFTDKGLNVNYDLEYLNRDTITEKEILEEGFTPDDDFNWSGSLGPIWRDELTERLASIKLDPKAQDENIWMHFTITEEGKPEKTGLVKQLEDWDFFIQELIQAAYEKAEKEMPLSLDLISMENGKKFNYNIFASFATRTSNINGKKISWEQMQEVVQSIFEEEYWEDPVTKPKHNGIYIDINSDGQFYRVENNDVFNLLITTFSNL